MAARIEVERGPCKGWTYRFSARELRIGRGAAHGIKLPDPAWADGCLHVEERRDGYLVTNEMPHTVFLDRQTLAEGEQRTWFPGARLQPTASTVLVLYVDEAGEEPELAGRGVVAVPPPGDAGGRPRWPSYVVLACLGLCLAGLLLRGLPSAAPARSPAQVQADYVRVREQLHDLQRDPRRAPEARRLLLLLADARYFEAWGRPREALDRYLEARDGGPRIAEGQAVHDFINRRIAELAAGRDLPESPQ